MNQASQEHGGNGPNGTGPQWSESQVAVLTLAGTLAIAALTALWAATHAAFHLGGTMPAIVYIVVGISGIMLFVTSMIPRLHNDRHAGLSFTAFWMLAIIAVFIVFKLFG